MIFHCPYFAVTATIYKEGENTYNEREKLILNFKTANTYVF